MNTNCINIDKPIISVLLPVYNAERYLRTAIESVLVQTYDNFELLVLDDGSDDNSLSILREYETKDDRVRIISRENKGLAVTLNQLISEASGKYLARMDADDICLPQRFEKQVAFLDSHPNHVVVGTRILLIDDEGLPLATMIDKFSHTEIKDDLLKGVIALCHPATMLRADEIRAVGGYNTELQCAQDYDLWLRVSERGKLANLPEALVKYRQHLSSIGYTKRAGQLHTIKTALLRTYKQRKLGIPDCLSSMDDEISAPPLSQADHHCKWAWWALHDGNVASARKHAMLAIRKGPFKIGNWRAFACAVRGR